MYKPNMAHRTSGNSSASPSALESWRHEYRVLSETQDSLEVDIEDLLCSRGRLVSIFSDGYRQPCCCFLGETLAESSIYGHSDQHVCATCGGAGAASQSTAVLEVARDQALYRQLRQRRRQELKTHIAAVERAAVKAIYGGERANTTRADGSDGFDDSVNNNSSINNNTASSVYVDGAVSRGMPGSALAAKSRLFATTRAREECRRTLAPVRTSIQRDLRALRAEEAVLTSTLYGGSNRGDRGGGECGALLCRVEAHGASGVPADTAATAVGTHGGSYASSAGGALVPCHGRKASPTLYRTHRPSQVASVTAVVTSPAFEAERARVRTIELRTSLKRAETKRQVATWRTAKTRQDHQKALAEAEAEQRARRERVMRASSSLLSASPVFQPMSSTIEEEGAQEEQAPAPHSAGLQDDADQATASSKHHYHESLQLESKTLRRKWQNEKAAEAIVWAHERRAAVLAFQNRQLHQSKRAVSARALRKAYNSVEVSSPTSPSLPADTTPHIPAHEGAIGRFRGGAMDMDNDDAGDAPRFWDPTANSEFRAETRWLQEERRRQQRLPWDPNPAVDRGEWLEPSVRERWTYL